MMWSARGPLWMGAVTLALLLGGFGAWAATSRLAGAIVAPGQIEVAQHRQIVQHPDGGVVESIRAAEGASVRAGDLLVVLDGADLRSEFAIVEGQLFEMQSRRARLEAERDDAEDIVFPPHLSPEMMDGQRKLFEARRDTLGQQTAQMARRTEQIASQIEGIDAQRAALAAQTELVGRELADQQSLLDRGLAQAARVLSLQRERARLEGDAGELTAQRAMAEGKITEIALEILRLAAARREEAITQLRDFGYQEAALAERRHALRQKLSRLEIRAPVSGIVMGLAVTTPRAVLRPAEPMLYLVPQDRPLVIAARIPAIHIDEVHAGQEVRLVFSAFASRTEAAGQVAFVSADAMTDDRSGQSFYRAEVLLDQSGLALLPGMPVEAFIRTGDRSPLAYLIKPFADYFDRALRES